MYFLCLITVSFLNTDDVLLIQNRELEGKMLSQSRDNLTLDFSGHAKVLGYVGDYSSVTVPKSECMRAK